MGLLDAILQQAGSAALGGGRGASGAGGIVDLVTKNPQIIAAALSMLNPKDTSVGGGGGLADVIGAFNKGGLGDVIYTEGVQAGVFKTAIVVGSAIAIAMAIAFDVVYIGAQRLLSPWRQVRPV